jgi:hypothetical protein
MDHLVQQRCVRSIDLPRVQQNKRWEGEIADLAGAAPTSARVIYSEKLCLGF